MTPRPDVLQLLTVQGQSQLVAPRYGAVSLGSCGMLMGLMFVGGAMNTLWVGLAALAFAKLDWVWPRDRDRRQQNAGRVQAEDKGGT